MAKAGTAYIDFEAGSFAGLHKAINAQLAPITSRFGKIGKAGVAGLGLVAGAAVGTGVALYRVGEAFDDANDTIRVGTGATGKRLTALQKVFKDVVKTVPTDFEHASAAVTQINQRLGLTGKPLASLSKRFLELSRLTKTDLSTNIESVTRVFGDWGIKTRDQAGRLDELFRASQKTGVPVAKLAEIMTKFGGPLRQLGFNFDQAAVMAGKFEKEGVNTQLVLGSMRIALGKMAKDGEAPVSTLRRVVSEIKNAGSAGEANKKALELFGARAGPDMAAAIREGRFELGNLERSIRGGKETILGASRDTQDFSEKLQILKNKALVALEPVATRVFGVVGKGLDKLTHVNFGAIIAGVKGFLQPLVSEISGIWNNPNLNVGQKIGKTISAAAPFIAQSAGQAFAFAAPIALKAFISAFQNGGAWTRLFAVGLLLSKLGVFSQIGRLAAAKLVDAFGKNLKFAGVLGGLIALMGLFGRFSGATKSAAAASRDLADALDEERNAIRGLRDQNLDLAQARATAKASALAVEQAERELDTTRKQTGKNSLAARQAENNLTQTRIQHKRDLRALSDAEEDASSKRRQAVTTVNATRKAQLEAAVATKGWAAGTADLRSKIAALPARKQVQIEVNVAQAIANIHTASAAIDDMLARAQRAIQAAKSAKASSNTGQERRPLKFQLEDELRILEQSLADRQALFDRKDAEAERKELKHTLTIARIRKITDSFSKADKRNAIDDATDALKRFNLEARRAKQLGKISLKITGKQDAIALRDALKGIHEQITGKISAALDKFRDKWDAVKGAAIDALNAATLTQFDKDTQTLVDNGPAAQKLAELQAENERLAQEAEDASNQQDLTDATAAGDKARIAEAQARIAETARQRAITAQQVLADNERKQTEERRANERKALEDKQTTDRQAAYNTDLANWKLLLAGKHNEDVDALAKQLDLQQFGLAAMLKAEEDQLKKRTENYSKFATDVTKILKDAGLPGFSTDADTEQTVEKAKPKTTTPAKPPSKPKAKAAATSSPKPNINVRAHFEMDGKVVDVRAKKIIVEHERKTAVAVAGGVG